MNHLFVTQDYAPDLGGMARRHVELSERGRRHLASVHAERWTVETDQT